MSLGRIQDPKGAKHLVISYQNATGVIATILRNRFPLMTYKNALTCRLKVDEKMNARDLRQPSEGSKKLLIYAADMHPRSIFSPTTCIAKSSPRERAALIATTLPQMDNYPDTEIMQTYTEQAHMDIDETGVGRVSRTVDTASTSAEGAAGPT
jgi:hypothetical protein